jgi:hypothetical protein
MFSVLSGNHLRRQTMKYGPFVVALAATALLTAPVAAGEGAGMELEGRLFKTVVETHPSQGDVREIEGSEAMLLTTTKGVIASLETSELTPGNAYTLWFVAINNPGACENTPCKGSDVLGMSDKVESDVGYGDGLIAGPDGTGVFTTHRKKGEIPQAWIGTGLTKPESAEIHLVVHDHGPLIAGREAEMIGTFRGGCTEDSLSKMAPDTARADGEPGPNTCKLIQDVIFMQSGQQTASQ